MATESTTYEEAIEELNRMERDEPEKFKALKVMGEHVLVGLTGGNRSWLRIMPDNKMKQEKEII